MGFSLPRCLLVWLTVSAVAGAASLWAAPDVTAVPRATSFDAYVAAGAGAALIGCGVWAWVVTTVVVACASRLVTALNGIINTRSFLFGMVTDGMEREF
ncbi:MAG: hypothetical protein KKA97_00715 [Actinobacteria bacterium]|nr:hypothetical protein [Actinomycetota bacterium]